MRKVVLGRTGLEVSVMGLGCGGPSRLGQRTGQDRAASIAVVRRAVDEGVNFFDSAEAYQTEDILGEALRDVPRESVVVSTKKSPVNDGKLVPPDEFRECVEAALRRLDMDYIDIFHLHGVRPAMYREAADSLFPVLDKLREQGKIRFPGVTEGWIPDPRHDMLPLALDDDCWDVIMVGFSLLNQCARDRVFPLTIDANVGTLLMFVVRRALSQPDKLRETIQAIIDRGKIEPGALDPDNPLGFLTQDGIAESVVDAAYRFARDEPGAHVILSGSGNPEHVAANARYLNKPPLPSDVTERLREVFALVDDETGN